MASCGSGGAISTKLLVTYQDFNKANCSKWKIDGQRCCKLESTHGPSVICFGKKPTNFMGLVSQPWRCPSQFAVSCSSQTKTQPEDVSEVEKSTGTSQLISSSEVQSLVSSICDTTSIAEFKLDLGGFRLYVKRDVNGHDSTASLPPITTPTHKDTLNEIPNQNGSAASSLAIFKPETSTSEIQRTIDANSDEGLVMLPSPKVGIFRRSRVIKGKHAPPPCKEKQEVKEGQVLCYIEQLGGEIPIESDVSGEVVKILRDDGEPVGYGDALIAILPSFPGIKKLQLPG